MLSVLRIYELMEGVHAVSKSMHSQAPKRDFSVVGTSAHSVVMRASYFRVHSSFWILKAKGISSMH